MSWLSWHVKVSTVLGEFRWLCLRFGRNGTTARGRTWGEGNASAYQGNFNARTLLVKGLQLGHDVLVEFALNRVKVGQQLRFRDGTRNDCVTASNDVQNVKAADTNDGATNPVHKTSARRNLFLDQRSRTNAAVYTESKATLSW